MRKLKEKMIALGFDPRREILVFTIVNIILLAVAAVLVFILKQSIYGICVGSSTLVFSLYHFSRYSSLMNKKNIKNLQEFTVLFGYFRIYIHNGYSVYSALKELMFFANEDLKNSIQKLVDEIDQDKSVQPFVKFGKQFNEMIIEEMMISVYQLIDEGQSSDYLMQFELIFDKFSDLLYQKYLKAKDSRLGTIASAPLVGSCFLIVVLTIGIIGIIGDFISGI